MSVFIEVITFITSCIGWYFILLKVGEGLYKKRVRKIEFAC